ncbi:MAG: oxidoreductase [Blastococcus sp.]|nr:oxidoreductase [Blastococcus sp.]
MSPREIVVVGAGLAGTNTCEQLRLRGFDGKITLLGAESGAPYDRPPLTKAVLSGDRECTTLDIDLAALNVDHRPGTAATGLRLADLVVECSAGELPFDGLVIATGARPITLPGTSEQHTIRTIDDARRLRAKLLPGAHVVVIGGSWIGAEVATAAMARGCRVTCIEAGPTVAHVALGSVGRRLEPWWDGVDLRLDTMVERLDDREVHLVGGGSVPADVLVVGVGVRPDVAWLRNSGLEIDRGVVVDERLRAADGVVALGDASSWWSRRYGRRLNVEHWDNAVMSASVAAATLLSADDAPVYDPIPYFWSDQFGHKIQYVGAHDHTARVVYRTAPDTDRWSAAWVDAYDRVVAMLVVDSPRDMVAARKLIAAESVVDLDRLADARLRLPDAAVGGAPDAVAGPTLARVCGSKP